MYDRISGVKPESVGEGTHFRIPWLQSPNVMDIRTRPRTISSVTGTKGALGGRQPQAPLVLLPRSHTVGGLQTCRWSTSPSVC